MTLLALLSVARATCPGDVPILDDLTCSSTISGAVGATDVSRLGGPCADGACYTCGDPHTDEQQLAPEAVYSFTCQREGSVALRITDLPCDLDIYVLDASCDPYEGCLYGSTAAFAVDDAVDFTCVPGEIYYIVVEAYGAKHVDVASGPCTDDGTKTGVVFDPTYTLTFDVSESTGCAEDCNNGIDDDLDGRFDCADSDCGTDPVCCDLDDDSYFGSQCGGNDCNDGDASVHPGATDIEDDGVDQDCDGSDATAPIVDTGDDTGPQDTDTDLPTHNDTDDGLDSGDGTGRRGCSCGGRTGLEPIAGAFALMPLLGLRRRRT